MGMKFRKVSGDERDRLLGSRKPSGFNYGPYFEVLDNAGDGDVVAVEVTSGSERGEKIRFSRAARQRGKSLNWLTSSNQNEIAFQVTGTKPSRPRGRKAQAPAE
jgi:hypothetical protein